MRMAACGAKRTSLDFRVKITAARPGIDDPIIVERQRRANHLCRLAITTLIVQPFLQKYSDFPKAQISCISTASCPERGALRNVINAGVDAVDAVALIRRTVQPADGKAVWS